MVYTIFIGLALLAVWTVIVFIVGFKLGEDFKQHELDDYNLRDPLD